MVLYLRMLRERVVAKNCCLLMFCLLQVKSFEKLVSNTVIYHLEKCGLFVISSMVSGLLV